jgi:hypothetical protein
MNQRNTYDEWPHMGPDDPPLDLAREEAAYARERERLVRDHLGKIALIVGDEVIGVFSGPDEALLEGYRRFGLVRMVCRPIEDPEEPDFISLVDITHPSFKRLD